MTTKDDTLSIFTTMTGSQSSMGLLAVAVITMQLSHGKTLKHVEI
jgi:hypothetical protein